MRLKGDRIMRNAKSLRYIVVFSLVLFAFSCVSIGAEKLSQDEIDAIIKGVENGEAEAQLRLGIMYGKGQNVKRDNEQAFYWLKKSYEQGNVEAQCLLAMAYATGSGVERDETQALKLLKQVAAKDPSSIQKVYSLDDNGTKIYSSAEELVATAQYMIGLLYFDGKDTNKDYEQAKYYFTKAAEHGSEQVKGLTREKLEELRILQVQRSSSTVTTSKPQPLDSGSVIEIDFAQAFRECRENGLVYKRKYDGKKVRVTEKIFFIGTDPYNERICVRLAYKEHDSLVDRDDLYCYFEENEADNLMKLKVGQRVTIEGTCKESVLVPFTLGNSRVVNANKSSNAQKTFERSSSQTPTSPSKTENVTSLSKPNNFDEAKGNAVIFLNSIEEVGILKLCQQMNTEKKAKLFICVHGITKNILCSAITLTVRTPLPASEHTHLNMYSQEE